MNKNLILIGPMGAGKTSVGRQLAKALAHTFYDSDLEIEKRTGVSIPTIFDIEGEAGFREREKNIIAELVRKPNIVLATGGGAVILEANRKLLKKSGLVIYLHAPVSMLYKRTMRDRNRPLLQTDDPQEKLREIMETREPLYRQTAQITIDTDRHSVRQVVRQILQKLEKPI